MHTKHSNLVKIGKIIQQLRKEDGYSQEEFAYAAGIARTYMGRIERGEHNISIQHLIKIAFTLNIEVGKLIPPISQLKYPT
ncbi:MAG: helix-turn-helix transcriptional regulator [Flavobacteriaceae bacterium]|nr:helix-turn-helix transcriptional regulator [Flavobacteriaceae bacterium]